MDEPPAAAPVRLGTFAALAYPNYRLWFFGQMTSLFGTWMQSMAQGYLIYPADALGGVPRVRRLRLRHRRLDLPPVRRRRRGPAAAAQPPGGHPEREHAAGPDPGRPHVPPRGPALAHHRARLLPGCRERFRCPVAPVFRAGNGGAARPHQRDCLELDHVQPGDGRRAVRRRVRLCAGGSGVVFRGQRAVIRRRDRVPGFHEARTLEGAGAVGQHARRNQGRSQGRGSRPADPGHHVPPRVRQPLRDVLRHADPRMGGGHPEGECDNERFPPVGARCRGAGGGAGRRLSLAAALPGKR